jgi:hypothetical protein
MDYSDGDLLEDFASVFCDGVLLVVMPVARLHLDLPPISFPGNVIFYPNGYAELDKLNIVPNHSASNSPPAFRNDDTPLNRKPGGLMEQSNASLQRGDQG